MGEAEEIVAVVAGVDLPLPQLLAWA